MAIKEAPDGLVYVHKHIGSMPMFLNWTMDVFFMFWIFFYLAINIAKTFFSFTSIILIGFLITYFYAKFKNSHIKGFFKHILYITGLKKPKYLLPSNQRYYVGS